MWTPPSGPDSTQEAAHGAESSPCSFRRAAPADPRPAPRAPHPAPPQGIQTGYLPTSTVSLKAVEIEGCKEFNYAGGPH